MTENQPRTIDLAIEARWIAPVDSEQRLHEWCTAIVQDGLIVEILPTESARQRYLATQTIRLDEHILIPGMINLHTHAAMNLMRGIADDISLMPWLQQYIWPTEQQFVSQRFVRDGALLACAEMLSGGITCFNDMYFFPQGTAEAALQAGMRANLGLVVLDMATAYASDADDYLQKGLEARDGWRNSYLLVSSLAPHAPYTLSNQTFEKVITYAEQLGIGIHTHLHETQAEIVQSLSQFGMRPLQRMTELGLLGPGLVAAHCVHLNDEERSLLGQYASHIAHCPTSNLKLASGIADIPALQARQVNIGLGSDGAASNNRLDLFAEMRLAALLAKGTSGDAEAVSADQALAMATINGARAMGMDDKIGSLTAGKLADMTAVRLSDIETLPCFDPIAHLVYVAGREHVSHVWVGGELRYQKLQGQHGVYAGIEPAELKEIVIQWQSKLTQYK